MYRATNLARTTGSEGKPTRTARRPARAPEAARQRWDARAVRAGFDAQVVVTGVLALLLAVGLGALAGQATGMAAGVLITLAAVASSAVLTVAMQRWSRNMARAKRREESLKAFAPPTPPDDGEEKV
jgi:hypothetical protein